MINITEREEDVLVTKEEYKINNEVIANYSLLGFKLSQDILYYILDDLSYKVSSSSFTMEDYILLDFYKDALLNEKSIFFNKKVLLVDELIIKNNFRGKNIGSSILEEVKQKAINEGYDYIVLKPYPIVEYGFDYSTFDITYKKIVNFYIKNNYVSLDLAGVDYQYFYQTINR